MPKTSGVLTTAASAFRLLAMHGLDHAEALYLTLELVTLRIAVARGLATLPSANPGAPALRRAITQLPNAAGVSLQDKALEHAWRKLTDIPEAALCPRLPGDLYPPLLQTPLVDDMSEASRRQHTRRAQGSYYTPQHIVDLILDLALDDTPARPTVCDPAMGTGHFLLACLDRLAQHSLEQARQAAVSRMTGVDRDSFAVRLARRALWLALSRPGDEFDASMARLVCGDSLLADAWTSSASGFSWGGAFPDIADAGGFDVIVGNPPYDVLTRFRTHPEAKRLADALRAREDYPLSLDGQINLYRCFIERALHLLKPGGALAFIVPGGLLRDHTARALRIELLTRHACDTFHCFGETERVFAGVSQAAVVFRARKGKGVARTLRVHNRTESVAFPLRTIKSLSADMIVPDARAEDWPLIKWLGAHCPRRFNDLAEGFVGEVDQTVYRAHMKTRDTGTLLVRGAHITPFAADLTPRTKKERFLDKEGFLQQKGKAAALCEPRVQRERVAQLGIRNMASRPRLIAARLPAGVYAGNSLNIWLPRNDVSNDLLLGLLNSRLLDWRFRLTSGNNNINLHEVEQLPVPETLTPNAVRAVENAARACEREAADDSLSDANRNALDDAVETLYGIPPRLRRCL